MGRKRKGKCTKKNIQAASVEPEHLTRAPHSFVFHRGFVGKYVVKLIKDFRKIMEPFTASHLKVRKKNTIRDLVSVAGPLHVSHLVMFTLTEVSPYLRIARIPKGPTLTFKIHNYVLSTDVASSLKKQYIHPKMFANPPLLVLNGFSGDAPELKLMISTFQGMFPTINVTKVDLNDVRRCLLVNYDSSTKQIEIRHYAIRVTPLGISRSIKKLVSTKVPNLSKFNDFSDFVQRGDLLSESEAEDDPNSHVNLPQQIRSKGNLIGNKSAIRLTELGPRMSLQLIKVEGGLMDGEVIYHEYVHKTEEEKAEILKRREAKRKLKLKRKQKQDENVKKKEELKEEHKKKSLEGIARKKKEWKADTETDKLLIESAAAGANQEDDDDAEWFRKEVGQEPEADLFPQDEEGSMKRKRDSSNFRPYKKLRTGGRKVQWKDQNDKNDSAKIDKDGGFKRRFNKRDNTQPKRFKSGNKQPAKKMGKRRTGTKVNQGKRHS